MRERKETKKGWKWLAIALVFIAAVVCTIYGSRLLIKGKQRFGPKESTLGVDLSIYVDADKTFVDAALAREGVQYTETTTIEQRRAGEAVYEIQETIHDLPFVTKLYFSTQAQGSEGEESEDEANELIPGIDLSKQNQKPRVRCSGYEKRWVSDQNTWLPAQIESADAIYADLCRKYGQTDKDNGCTYLRIQGKKYTPETMSDEILKAYQSYQIAGNNYRNFRAGWVKTIAKSSFGDDCVEFKWGLTSKDKIYIRILQTIPADYPYTVNKQAKDQG